MRTQIHTTRLIHTAEPRQPAHNTYRLLVEAFEGDFTDHGYGDHALGGCTRWSNTTARSLRTPPWRNDGCCPSKFY